MGVEAERTYADTQSTVYASRLVSGTWTTPAFTGSASGRLGIATVP